MKSDSEDEKNRVIYQSRLTSEQKLQKKNVEMEISDTSYVNFLENKKNKTILCPRFSLQRKAVFLPVYRVYGIGMRTHCS